MNAPHNLDELLKAAGRRPKAGADPAGEGVPPVEGSADGIWRRLEDHLQQRAEALARGDEAPGLPDELADAMIERPDLRRAYRRLALPVAQAVKGEWQQAEILPETIRHTLHKEAGRGLRERAAEATERAKTGAISVLAASVSYLRESWAAVAMKGFQVVESELLLARGAAESPIAMQGRLGEHYLVAMSLSGDPRRGNVALDMQCQEFRPGDLAPQNVPAFCLRDEQGHRYHSRDRLARVANLAPGRHIFTLEVVGSPKGMIELNIEAEE